ncbi:MAG: diguanylate cyclase [Thermodesulfobacteriota bacterium]|nr:diguanylate cyclase [Thermodesulfobacteriota bacterium]
MDSLKALLLSNEAWLMQRILYYAKRQGYAKYTSTLLEAWRLSISGMTEAIVQAIDSMKEEHPEFWPDVDYTTHPVAAFGVTEARLHRTRGISLAMFLGLLKYYRQTYQDLIREKVKDPEQGARFGRFVVRCFDLLEIALSSEWNSIPREEIIQELQVANRALTNKKNRYLTVFESIGDPVFILDANGLIVNLNMAAARLLQLQDTPGESFYLHSEMSPSQISEGEADNRSRMTVVGQPLAKVLPWLDTVVISAQEDTGKALLWEFKTEHYGKTSYFMVSLSGMLDVSGKYEGAVVVISDVTEQRNAQVLLEVSEERLSMALDATSDGMWDWNIVENELFLSAQFYIMLGYDPYAFEPTYESMRNLIHPDDLLRVEDLIGEHFLKATSFGVEFRMRTASGDWQWILSRGKVVEKNADGQPVRMVGTHMNVTERRKAEEALAKREAQFRGIFDNAGSGIALLFLNGAFKSANRNFREMLSIEDLENQSGLKLMDLLRSDFTDGVASLFERFGRGEVDSERAERVMVSRDGHAIWTDQSLSLIRDGAGNPQSIALVCVDVSDRVKAQEALQKVTERLRLATKAGGIGVWEWDILADKLVWDDRMMALYQVHPDEFSGFYDAWHNRVHPADIDDVESALKRAIETSGQFNREFRIVLPSNEVRYMNVSALTEYYFDQRPVRMIGVCWDITERKQMEGQIRKLAATDPLTGVSNRRSFMAQAEAEFSRCRRYERPLSFLMIDIDHFKKINDKYGHHVGDEALQAFTQTCMGILRDNDILGRIGGEEFAVILVEIGLRRALQVAERLRSEVASETIVKDDISLTFHVSVGLTVLKGTDNTIDDTMQRADRALYRAKSLGRNRVASA